jgi:hypothetical protein
MNRLILILSAGCALLTIASSDEIKQTAIKTDPLTGLKMTNHWEVVRNNCIACHSANQFLKQRGTRQTWVEILRWMQKSQGLTKFTSTVETQILDYLVKNHGPVGRARRALIPPSLLPKNPYTSDARKEFEARKQKGELPQ